LAQRSCWRDAVENSQRKGYAKIAQLSEHESSAETIKDVKRLLRIDPHKVEALLAVEETRRTILEEIRKLLDDAFQKHRPPLSLLTHSPNWYIGLMLPQIPETFGEKPSTLKP